jgi:hypothetical protein
VVGCRLQSPRDHRVPLLHGAGRQLQHHDGLLWPVGFFGDSADGDSTGDGDASGRNLNSHCHQRPFTTDSDAHFNFGAANRNGHLDYCPSDGDHCSADRCFNQHPDGHSTDGHEYIHACAADCDEYCDNDILRLSARYQRRCWHIL